MERLITPIKITLVLICLMMVSEGKAQYLKRKAKTLPLLNYVTLDENTFDNKKLKEKQNLLLMYFDPTCEICHNEIMQIMNNLEELEETEIILISPHPKTEIEKFAEKFQLQEKKQVVILMDREGNFPKQFKAETFPAIFLYNTDRILVGDFDSYADFNEIKAEFNQNFR
ncbi:MAG: redoxin domain-containing protein [Cytophagaceae bacterium]